MGDQEVIYSTLRFPQFSSESQNRIRSGGTQRPGKSDDKDKFSVLWRLTAVTLGILCLLLLMTTVVLGTIIFQYIQEKHQQDEILPMFRQKYYILQNGNLTKQLLTNETLKCDILKNKTCQLYEDHSCCRIKCYFFTSENKNWMGCKQTCQSYGLSLLNIDDEDELAFLQPQTYQNNY
ncbi:LOW QUALITY PROTEIN: killer cell lectin-like receptor 2 [Rhynchonycteris naso]